jgi:hypothetical protein
MALEGGFADLLGDGLGAITSLVALTVGVERFRQGDHRWPGLITLVVVAWLWVCIVRAVRRRRRNPAYPDAPGWNREQARVPELAFNIGSALVPLLLPLAFGLHASSVCISGGAFFAVFAVSGALRIRWHRAGYDVARPDLD